jgi:putative FmdB family regulatory protein
MPLYEYRCTECGAEFEKQLRFAEADQIPQCPECESPKTRKKLSRVASFGSKDSSVSIASSSCNSRGGFS